MTTFAPTKIFEDTSRPVEPFLIECREMLQANDSFLGFFRAIDQPAAVLSTCRRLVLANSKMQEILGMPSDEAALGAVLADPAQFPGQCGYQAQIRYLEIQGLVFFIFTLPEQPGDMK